MVKTRSTAASTTVPSPRRLRSSTIAQRPSADHNAVQQLTSPAADRENAMPSTPRVTSKKVKTGSTDVTKADPSSSAKRQEKPKSILTERDASKANTEGGPTQNIASESKEEVHVDPPISATLGIRVPTPTDHVPTLEESYPADSTSSTNVMAVQESSTEVEAEWYMNTLFNFDEFPAWNDDQQDPSPDSGYSCFSGRCNCKFESVFSRLDRLSDIPKDIRFSDGKASFDELPSDFLRTTLENDAKEYNPFPFLNDPVQVQTSGSSETPWRVMSVA